MVVMVVVMVVTPTTVTTVSAAATTPRTPMTSVPVMMAVPPSEVLVSTFIELRQIISHRLKTRPTAMVVVVVMVMVMMVSSRMPMMIAIPPSTVHLSACFEVLRIISHCLEMRPTTMVVMVVIMVMVVMSTSMPMMISIPPGAVQTEVLRIGLNCVHLIITDLVEIIFKILNRTLAEQPASALVITTQFHAPLLASLHFAVFSGICNCALKARPMVVVVVVVMMVVTPPIAPTAATTTAATPTVPMTRVPMMIAIPPCEILGSTFIERHELLRIISHRLKTRRPTMVMVVMVVMMVMVLSSRMPMMISIPPRAVQGSTFSELLRIVNHLIVLHVCISTNQAINFLRNTQDGRTQSNTQRKFRHGQRQNVRKNEL